MKVHEYQAKGLLADAGVPIPQGKVADTPSKAAEIAKEFGGKVVVKAQVHVGGRGKAGGVKLADDAVAAEEIAKEIIGMSIKGIEVRKVLVECGIDIAREFYLGVIIDRAERCPVIIASAAGGVEIEEVAKNTPEKILTVPVPTVTGIQPYQLRTISGFLGIPDKVKALGGFLRPLLDVFNKYDASLAEINPLVITGAGEMIACDAKINFDDNALFRHPEIEELRDVAEEDPAENEAREKALNFVKLDGTIGCIVNGAGLAMGTMDIVKHFGGEPANFLDIGGGAKAEQVTDALKIITRDPSVNTILFNIFGGIVRCDRVAEGILTALNELDFDLPIVIRLTGTNEEEAKKMLEGTSLLQEPNMSAAAKRAVEISKERGAA